MNDNQISALGEFCSQLLGSEAFQALTAMYSQQCAVDILQTQPHEFKKREQVYASYLGFEGFLALARKYAETHASINAEITEDTKDDPRVHDIYADAATDTMDDPRVHDIYDGMN